ncbi:hypothetical protein D9611_011700 [Ephemerocybe angulata]|uniref:F-box domain-containing protein n=1 Tax=Ephemerocybe angulata TaxID=980116 RepID=A0A8H5C7G4_9AGAR|nr:hypothetical protein D9611_011700 [Tulosesus angulatus]
MSMPVPLELLLTIFDFAVHTSSLPATGGPTGKVHKDTEYPESQLQPGIIAHTTNPFTPLHISHVCKDWRNAAFSAPELWSSIYVADGSPSTPKLLLLWLQNSRSRPLDIIFRDTPHGSSGYDSGGTIVEMIQMAAEHSVRWRTFKVKLRRQELPMKEVNKALHGIGTPLLQTLAFSFNPADFGYTRPDDLWISLIANAPKLQELQMWSTRYPEHFLAAIPFDRLTCITLIMVRFQDGDLFWKALRGCKVLRTLAVSFGLRPEHITQTLLSLPVVSIPSLRHLNLIGGTALCLLLLRLHAPSLSSLTIHTNLPDQYVGRPTTDVYMALEDFLTRSGCQLLSFKIRDDIEGPRSERRLSPILRHCALRHLVDLTLGNPVGEDTLEMLVRSPKNDGLLQRLKRIDLQALAIGGKIGEIPQVAYATEMAASRSGDSRPAVNLASLTVGFMLRTQLIHEIRTWDEQVAEKGNLELDKVFYFVDDTECTRRLKDEFLYRDFSMIQRF